MKASDLLILVAVMAILTAMTWGRIRKIKRTWAEPQTNVVDIRFKSEPPDHPVSISTNSPYFERSFYRIQGLVIKEHGGSAQDISEIQKREMDGEKNAILHWINEHSIITDELQRFNQEKKKQTKIP